MVTTFTTVHPQETLSDTEQFAIRCAESMAEWLRDHRAEFGRDDRFQIVVAWSKSVRPTGRQIVKVGGKLSEVDLIIDRAVLVQMHGNWARGVFDKD